MDTPVAMLRQLLLLSGVCFTQTDADSNDHDISFEVRVSIAVISASLIVLPPVFYCLCKRWCKDREWSVCAQRSGRKEAKDEEEEVMTLDGERPAAEDKHPA